MYVMVRTAASAIARRTISSRRNCIESSLHGLGRHLRLQLPRVEGQFLSRRSRRGEDAAVLRRTFSDGRDQLHVLPHADGETRRWLGRADAVAVSDHAQGAAADHPRQRDEGYQPDDIKQWAETIATSTPSCRDVFVYFKHEESGKGPEFARLLMDQLGL